MCCREKRLAMKNLRRIAYQILLLENGRITERGTFRDLVNRHSKFASMRQLQQNT
jgi:ABC-type multidrug transport system fused ATPase/permease subunit